MATITYGEKYWLVGYVAKDTRHSGYFYPAMEYVAKVDGSEAVMQPTSRKYRTCEQTFYRNDLERIAEKNGGKIGLMVWGIGRTKKEAEEGFVKCNAFGFAIQEAENTYEKLKIQMSGSVKNLTDLYDLQTRVTKSKSKQ